MAIHREFADWYRAAAVAPPVDLLEARWRAVEPLAENLDRSQLVALLQIYADQNAGSTKSVPEFVDKAFREQDPSFPSRDNWEEIRVLAGAVLRQVLENDDGIAVSAAQGIVAVSFGSRLERLATTDHIAAARRYLAKKSESLREVKGAPFIKSSALTKERYEELMPTAAFAANSLNGIRDPLFDAMTDQANRANAAIQQLSTRLWRVIEAQREELNMLWWLQTRVSRDLNQPFENLASTVASIVFAAELADLTAFIPGPVAASALLSSALVLAQRPPEDLTVVNAVNAVPRDWRETRAASMVEEKAVLELCPILFAIVRSLDTEGANEWLPVFKKQCNVRIDQLLQPDQIANQLYAERLFIKSLPASKT